MAGEMGPRETGIGLDGRLFLALRRKRKRSLSIRTTSGAKNVRRGMITIPPDTSIDPALGRFCLALELQLSKPIEFALLNLA